jgi:hypothetical protein
MTSHDDSNHNELSRNEFWERVNAAFDAQRDPLEDARVQQLLEREPELLEELAALQLMLDTTRDAARRGAGLRAAGPARRRASAVVGWAALAAGFAAIVVAARWNAPEPRSPESAQAPAAPEFRTEPVLALLEFRATFTRRHENEVHTITHDLLSGAQRVTAERVLTAQPDEWIAIASGPKQH